MINEPKITKMISPNWDRLIRIASRMKFGELKIVLQNGDPVRIEYGVGSIKLDTDEDVKKAFEITPLFDED